jgi:hypothetical protein
MKTTTSAVVGTGKTGAALAAVRKVIREALASGRSTQAKKAAAQRANLALVVHYMRSMAQGKERVAVKGGR